MNSALSHFAQKSFQLLDRLLFFRGIRDEGDRRYHFKCFVVRVHLDRVPRAGGNTQRTTDALVDLHVGQTEVTVLRSHFPDRVHHRGLDGYGLAVGDAGGRSRSG